MKEYTRLSDLQRNETVIELFDVVCESYSIYYFFTEGDVGPRCWRYYSYALPENCTLGHIGMDTMLADFEYFIRRNWKLHLNKEIFGNVK